MFFGKFYFQLFIIGIFVFLSAYVKSEPFILVSVDADISSYKDYYGESALEYSQSVMCPLSGLRDAMSDEQMVQIVADQNVFHSIEGNDVVRLQKGVGFYWIFNPLRTKIHNTYEDFYRISQLDFALNIATYPAEVLENTCSDASTIIKVPMIEGGQNNFGNFDAQLLEEQLSTSETLGVQREISGVFGEYLTVEGRAPRHFELRENQNGDMVVCEVSRFSLEERMNLYCEDNSNEKCRKQMPPLCSDWDERASEFALTRNVCSSVEDFEKIFAGFLLRNKTMKGFCPDDCSYYVQMFQKLHREGENNCVESHTIVHCGPKKREARYNLNIKVVDNFCEDYNVMCIPVPQVAVQ